MPKTSITHKANPQVQRLAIKAKQGDREALNQLFVITRKVVLGIAGNYAKRHTADVDDFINAGLMELYRRFDGYDPDRHAWMSYAKKCFDWACKDFMRKRENNPTLHYTTRSKKHTVCRTQLGDLQVLDEKQEAERINRDAQDEFEDRIKGLDHTTRIVFRLMYLHGFDQVEVANTLDLSPSRISQIHSAGKRLIKETAGDDGQDGFRGL